MKPSGAKKILYLILKLANLYAGNVTNRFREKVNDPDKTNKRAGRAVCAAPAIGRIDGRVYTMS